MKNSNKEDEQNNKCQEIYVQMFLHHFLIYEGIVLRKAEKHLKKDLLNGIQWR